jgi:hypothetical protein
VFTVAKCVDNLKGLGSPSSTKILAYDVLVLGRIPYMDK